MLDRLEAPSPVAGPEIGRRRFQIGLRGLLIVVACCAPLCWLAREAWDRRPMNEPERAFRMLGSGDESERLSGLMALRLLVTLKSLTPKQVDAATTALLVALATALPKCAKPQPALYSRSCSRPDSGPPPCRRCRRSPRG